MFIRKNVYFRVTTIVFGKKSLKHRFLMVTCQLPRHIVRFTLNNFVFAEIYVDCFVCTRLLIRFYTVIMYDVTVFKCNNITHLNWCKRKERISPKPTGRLIFQYRWKSRHNWSSHQTIWIIIL